MIRDGPKDGNKTLVTPTIQNPTPSIFSRAFFKNDTREIPTEDKEWNKSRKEVLAKEEDNSVFLFSVPTPRNLVVEDAASRAIMQAEKSLKRQYDWINEQ